jgi:hypothetical protein
MAALSKRDSKKADQALEQARIKRDQRKQSGLDADRLRRLAARAKLVAERELEAAGGEGGS